MEFCPYCQRWVEPTKSNTDILVGLAFGGWLGALIGVTHYLLKGSRCPICNNVIKGSGALKHIPYQPIHFVKPAINKSVQPFPYPLTTLKLCPRCKQPLVWLPSFKHWYCPYCQLFV